MKVNNMKKSLWIVLAVVAVLAVWGYSVYNGLVEKEEAVHGAWSNVETQYQRRSDLIPNLVNTVKGYAAHERQTLAAVVDARSKATSMNVDADDLTPERLAAFQQAQEGVRSALGRLIAVAENYAVRRFPANLVAGILSFGQKPYFEADDSAAQAPEVAF